MDRFLEQGREFLTDRVRKRVDFARTPQARGAPPPPLEKEPAAGVRRVRLPALAQCRSRLPALDTVCAMERRRSRREFSAASLPFEQLSFLLWATQGVARVLGPGTALRTVPSAGARHALETYLSVHRVDGLAPGLYYYRPVEHELVEERAGAGDPPRLAEACFGQGFAGTAAVTFIWTTVPARMEWRYGPASYKVIALDAGHVCQNLYLACEVINAGTCAIAAYDQEAMDAFLGVDGHDEFTVYVAPVGTPAAGA